MINFILNIKRFRTPFRLHHLSGSLSALNPQFLVLVSLINLIYLFWDHVNETRRSWDSICSFRTVSFCSFLSFFLEINFFSNFLQFAIPKRTSLWQTFGTLITGSRCGGRKDLLNSTAKKTRPRSSPQKRRATNPKLTPENLFSLEKQIPVLNKLNGRLDIAYVRKFVCE